MKLTTTILALTIACFALSNKATAQDKNLLKNGNMSKGHLIPVFWEKISNWGGSKLKVSSDAKVFKSAPASLRLEPTKGSGKGCVSQFVKGCNGKLKISGAFRVEPGKNGNALIAMQLFDKAWKSTKWIQVACAKPSDDWVEFEKEINITTNPAHIQVLMMIDGNSKAWLDDIVLEKVK